LPSRKPRALRPGDVLGVATPAGPVEAGALQRGVRELEALGFAVRVGEGALERTGFTAGSIEGRLAQLERLFRDPEIGGIVCARGGAGAGRLLNGLEAGLLRLHAKPLVGYSDITWLHLALGRLGLVSLHGPMVARELAEGEAAYHRESLWHALTGEGDPYVSGPGDLHPLRPGAAEGVLRGGCLSILAAAAGTPWDLRPGGEATILFLEDVDEAPYRIDRMLFQLRAAGALDGVRGIVFGEMKGCSPGADADYALEETVLEALEGLELPVAFGLPSGHATRPNVTLPLGVAARLRCGASEARLEVVEVSIA
jgi:muramoyltetrapeptide carboxypeptidase